MAQNEAFDQQMREAQAIARGTSGGGGGTQRTSNDFGASGYANEFTGLGSGPSIPDFASFEKGGLASKPKAKAKRKKNTKGLGTKPKAT